MSTHGHSADRNAIVAAVDLGSNSIKMTVGRRDAHGGLEELAWASETVRLGRGVAEHGVLADDRIHAALDVLTRFAAEAREHGASRFFGVATEATRVARNGPAFLERVQHEAGWEIRAISGDEEAALTFRGLTPAIDLSGTIVVADIGGGSTEVIVADGGEIAFAESLKIGSGALTERFVLTDPPTAQEIAAARDATASILRGINLPTGERVRLVVVGGTGEYLARLVPEGSPLTRETMRVIRDLLQRVSANDLAATLAIAPERAHVLPAGIAVVWALDEHLSPGRIDVARSGIRTGLLLDALMGPL